LSETETSFLCQNAPKHLAVGLRPDQLGELKRSPRSQIHGGRSGKIPLPNTLTAVRALCAYGGGEKELKEGQIEKQTGKFIQNIIARDFIFSSKCIKNVWRPGTARNRLGSLCAPHKVAICYRNYVSLSVHLCCAKTVTANDLVNMES